MVYSRNMASKKVTLATLAAQMTKGFAALTGRFGKMEGRFDKMEAFMERGFAAVAGDIADIRVEMMTKDDGKKMEERLTDRINGVDSKASGIQRSLDDERLQRTDLKIPRRLHDVEEKVYGVGGSKHPRNVPL